MNDDVDNCVNTVNPGQLDTDGDGMGKKWILGTNFVVRRPIHSERNTYRILVIAYYFTNASNYLFIVLQEMNVIQMMTTMVFWTKTTTAD